METKNKVKVIKNKAKVKVNVHRSVFVTDLWTTIHIRLTRNSELSHPSDLLTIENTRVIHRQYIDNTQ